MKKPILSAKGLCKSFAHNGVQNHILTNLDIEIYEGDFPTESKGCFAQAWSVGEILRVFEAIEGK